MRYRIRWEGLPPQPDGFSNGDDRKSLSDAPRADTHGLLRDAGFTLPRDAGAWDGISAEEA